LWWELTFDFALMARLIPIRHLITWFGGASQDCEGGAMIPIPIPNPMGTARYTLRGEALKTVRCEQCRCYYVYKMVRQATGEATSLFSIGAERRARSRAEEQLRAALVLDCDVVPCPECGWVHSAMIPEARRLFRRWMHIVGIVSVAAAGLLSPFALFWRNLFPEENLGGPLWAVTAGAVLFGCGMMLVRKVQAAAYDPNALDVEALKSAGRARAVRVSYSDNGREFFHSE
jgi:hypothetical protein